MCVCVVAKLTRLSQRRSSQTCMSPLVAFKIFIELVCLRVLKLIFLHYISKGHLIKPVLVMKTF